MPDRYPIGNALVPYGTPLHVTELFLRLLKLTFAELPEDYPYRYVADDFDKSGIAFDVALNKESGIYGKKPLVVVSRGAQNTAPMDIGDFAHGRIATNLKIGSNLYASSVNFQVVSKTKAEVEIIGQHIFGFVMMCRTHLPRLCCLHMVQSVVLSDVTKMEDDDTMFIAQGSFSYVGQYVWTQTQDDPVLASMGVTVGKLSR